MAMKPMIQDWVGFGAAKKTSHSNISIDNSRKALRS